MSGACGLFCGRIGRVLALVGLVVLVGFAGTPSANAAEPGLRLAGEADRAGYRLGEPVVLRWSLTNGGSAPCQISRASYGTLTIEVARDGRMVFGEVRPIAFAEDLGSMVISGLTTLAPGARVDIAETGGADVHMVSWSPAGQDLVTGWPLNVPGGYEITARYAMPPVAGLPGDVCPGTSSSAAVRFEVTEDRAGGFPVWIMVLGGLVLLALVLFGAWWLVRRHHRAGTAAAVLLVAIAVAIGTAPAAQAKVSVDNRTTEFFKKKVYGCFDKFRAPGGDPKKIFKFLEDIPQGITITEQRKPDRHGITLPSWAKPTGPWPQPAGTEIKWHEEVGEEPRLAGENHPDNPCAVLYHELYHAYQFARAFPRNWLCGKSKIDYSEVEATFAENEYREAQNLRPLRHSYGGQKLPKYENRNSTPFLGCESVTIAPETKAKKRQDCTDGCGMTRTDPHLLTFDRARYDFQAAGEFVAARSADGAIEVHTRQTPLSSSKLVSVNRAVAMRVGGDRVGFYDDERGVTVRVNGQPVTVGAQPVRLPGGGTLAHPEAGADYEVSWPDGSSAWVSTFGMGVLNLTLRPDRRHQGRMSGLLGDFDGDPADDLTTRQGTSVPQPPAFDRLYGEFADSWRVTPAESLLDYAPGESTDTFTDKGFPAGASAAAELPNRGDAEAACRVAGVSDPAVLAECALDVGLTGQATFISDATETQAVLSGPGSAFGLSIGDSVSGDVPGPGAGRIDTPGERDTYHFVGSAGQQLALADPVGSCAIRLTVLDPQDQQIAGAGGCDGPLRFTPSADGVHRIEVTGATGGYAFALRPVDGPTAELADGAEVSPDQPWPGAGRLGRPGEVDSYDLRVDHGRAFFLIGTGVDCAIEARLDGPSGQLHQAVHLCGDETRYAVPEPGRYRLRVSAANDTTGDYRFRFATEKPRTFAVGMGDHLGRLDLPGRVDRYEFDTTGRNRFRITGGTDACDDIVFEVRIATDQESWRTARLGACGDYRSVPVPLGTNRTVILVYSRTARAASYSLTIGPSS